MNELDNRRNSEIEFQNAGEQSQNKQVESLQTSQVDKNGENTEENEKHIEENVKTKIISKKTQRILIIIADVIAVVGFIVYCIFIQSYFSTLYLVCLILLLNYSYITLYKGVQMRDGVFKSLDQFQNEQNQIIMNDSQIEEDDNNQFRFKPPCCLIIFDIKRYIWLVIVIFSVLDLLFKTIMVPILATVTNTVNLMSIHNYNGLEIYFTTNGDIAEFDTNQYLKMFLPNSFIVIFGVFIICSRNITLKTDFRDLKKSTNLTKLFILCMLVFLIILTCTSRSLIGLFLWLFQLLLLYKMYQEALVQKEYYVILKYFIITVMILMYFLSTPIQNLILQGATASYTLQFIGIELLSQYSQYTSEAIVFTVFALIVFNLLCLIQRKINQEIIQLRFQITIDKIDLAYAEFKEFVASQNPDYQTQELQDFTKIQQEVAEKEDGVVKEKQDQEEEKKSISKQNIENSQILEQQPTQSMSFQEFIIKLKHLVDQPIVSLRILQLFCIITIILQKTYFSILILLWILLTGFINNQKVIKYAAIILCIPALIINFFTFYYENIFGMTDRGNMYQFCPSPSSKIAEAQCQKLGFFTQQAFVVNICLMDITICLFVLFIKQVDQINQIKIKEQQEQYQQQKQQQYEQDKDKEISWLSILLIIFFKFSFILSMTLLYWVGFNTINIIQFILVFLLIIYIVNQSTLCVYQNRIFVAFQFKYWIVIVVYISFLSLIKYLYALFGQNSNQFVVQVIGLNTLNDQEILYWVLYIFVILQYYGFQSEVYQKHQNRIIEIIAQKQSIKRFLPNLNKNSNFFLFLYYRIIIWVSFVVNLCFLLFTPFSYTNTVLLFIVGIIFLHYVQKIMTFTDYQFFKMAWYFYLNCLILTFTVRYLMSFICVPDVAGRQTDDDYRKIKDLYQQYGLYAYQPIQQFSRLRSEYLPDTLNIFFGSLAYNAFSKFALWQKIIKGKAMNQLIPLEEQLAEKECAKLMDYNVIDQWKWMKKIIILYANLNTDIITIYIVLACVFSLRSIAAFILLVLYLSYFYKVHDRILEQLQNNQILVKLQDQVQHLKSKYLEFKESISDENDIKILYNQIQILRRSTRIKLKRKIWIISFYFTAFCIYLSYISQFLSSESITSQKQEDWVKYTATAFFVFGTYAKQTQLTNESFCGVYPEDQSQLRTQSNIWSVIWFLLFLLLVNVIDTSCTKILMEELEKDQIHEYDMIDQKLELEQTPLDSEKIKNKYDFVVFEKNTNIIDEIRNALVINYYINKDRMIKILLMEALFKILQRILVLLYLCNTILVNTIFSLFYLGSSTYLLIKATSIKNIKLLNQFAIFAIWFQYFLYLLNWSPDQSAIPSQSNLTSNDFNVMDRIGLTNSQWKSYLGFQNSDIMNCQQLDEQTSLFYGQKCETNNLLNWVIFFNCIVVSLIYLYFIIIEWLANQIYLKCVSMRRDLNLTLKIIEQHNPCKIIINQPLWKTRNYTFKQSILQIITRNFHMVVLAIVILLAEMDRVIFNLLEMTLAIGFIIITEFYLEWPYLIKHRHRIYLVFQILFYIPVITIALFTLLKIPNLLNNCVNIQKFDISDVIFIDAPNSFIFYCMEVFNIQIRGMVFIMFFIALYFDLVNSNHYRNKMRDYQFKEQLRARMVSRALAYNQTYTQYKDMLQIQEEKNIFIRITQIIEYKLKFWKQKAKGKKEEIAEQSSQLKSEFQFPQLYQSTLQTEEEKLEKLPFFKKMLIQSILWFKTQKHQYKFMPFPNLMEFILQQNQALNQHNYVDIINYLKQDLSSYNKQLDFIDKFYLKLQNKLIKQHISISDDLDPIVQVIVKYLTIKYRGSESISKQLQKSIKNQILNKKNELQFVHIYDPEDVIVILDTKVQFSISKLIDTKTSTLISITISELFKYTLSNWDTICYVFIILYYGKNSSMLGALLPFVMFCWALIDTSQHLFWLIAYSLYVFIILIVFINNMYGVTLEAQQLEMTWYFPLIDSLSKGLFFEIWLLWIIVFQVFLMKQFGIYLHPIEYIENIFSGYIRMKINNFNQEIKKQFQEQQLEESDIDLESLELQNQESQESQNSPIIQQSQQQQQQQQEINEKQNELESKIIANPNLLFYNSNAGFFDRIFTFEYAKPGRDLYIPIAFVQVFLFLYILFFFNFMIDAQQRIDQILKYNQIPGTLVGALLAHMLLMVSERFIELRDDKVDLKKKSLFKQYKTQFVLKYILQITILILVGWFVFIHIGRPYYNSSSEYSDKFITNSAIICFFLIYCIYFYLSALQLKYGFRELKVRNQMLYSYGTLPYILAQTFYAIPFLFELKVLMDWTALSTSLDIFQWFQLEDIHGKLYFAKNQSLGSLRRIIGQKIGWIQKLSLGFCLVVLILMCILGPLILFSSLNPATQYNPITGGELQISLINVNTSLNVILYESNQFYGLNQTITSKDDIDRELNQLVTNQLVLNQLQNGGIQHFQLVNFSDRNWKISKPLYLNLVQELEDTVKNISEYHFMFNVSYKFQREQSKLVATTTKFSYPYDPQLMLYAGHELPYLNYNIVTSLYNSIANCVNSNITLLNFYIEFLQLYQGDGTSISSLPILGDGLDSVMSVNASFSCSSTTKNPLNGPSWWSFTYDGTSDPINPPGAQGLLFFVICDKYSSLTYGLSLITIYTSVILIIATYIRSTFSGQIGQIEFSGMVRPDDLLLICQAISVARSIEKYQKENLLFFELIDIIRSPEIVKVMTGSWQEAIKEQKDAKVKEKLD